MAIEQRQSTVSTVQRDRLVRPDPASAPLVEQPGVQAESSVSRSTMVVERSGTELARRIVTLVFGLTQAVILLRIVLLLLDARTGNALVSGILDVSRVFVAPFEGVLNTNALAAGGSVLDVAAVVALVGWTLIELLAFAIINVFRRESDYPA